MPCEGMWTILEAPFRGRKGQFETLILGLIDLQQACNVILLVFNSVYQQLDRRLIGDISEKSSNFAAVIINSNAYESKKNFTARGHESDHISDMFC